MKIGITDTMVSEDKFQFYVQWLENAGISSSEWVRLSYKLDNLTEVDKCDGLLLTGGNDIDPNLYGSLQHHPKIVDVDRRRDDFERNALDKALKRSIPILGICRGMQLVNVYFGGTLIPDIEEAGFNSHSSLINAENKHAISVAEDSKLREITGVSQGVVNSSHHQAVDKPGRGLKVVAYSTDRIIESMEWKDRNDYSFFLLIQWHPERMTARNNSFSENVLKEFLNMTSKYSNK